MSDKNTPVKDLTTREKMLVGMDEIIRHLNNEDAIEPWLMCGVPDGADIEEVCEMANDDEQFSYCASLFLDIMSHKRAYSDGVYVDGLKLITNTSRHEDEE